MFYVANRILNDEFLAEDVVHQAFLKIIENIDKIDDIQCHKREAILLLWLGTFR